MSSTLRNVGCMMMYAGAVVFLTAPAFAQSQSHPNFSGTWARVDSLPEKVVVATVGDAAFRVGDMGTGWDSPFAIRQSPDSIIVEFQHFTTYDLQPRLHLAFALDGSVSRNAVTIGHTESVQRAQAQWRGDTLVLSSHFPLPPGVSASRGDVRQALSLDSAGRLVVEATRAGYRTPNVVRTVFVRR